MITIAEIKSKLNPSAIFNNKKYNKVILNSIQSLYDWIEAIILSLICVVLAFIFIFRIVGVDGTSMVPTLNDKERLILTTFFYTPKRGDIVVIDTYTREPLVKRVIAVSGDSIAILPDTGEVVLNGVVLEEDYTQGITVVRDFGTKTRIVPKGYLVVMGDNREISKDSRSEEVGYINQNDVVGKAIFRFSPLNRIGFLK
ncbi:MAG: signal peptidase I [Oscillospiraceae bacterium]|nr:signal peptidase I [Oscillospiraceae bacterium]MDD4413546.1 signal peptidase I [Oscillospiraceae bacterium]